MRRSIRTLLGVTAAAGIVALGVPAVASPAAAATAGTSPAVEWRTLGEHYSANAKAKFEGDMTIRWSADGERNRVRVRGRLADLDYRTFEQGGKCALVKFDIRYLGEPDYAWIIGPRYRWCGADKAPRFFSFKDRQVDAVRVQVCQIDKYSGRVEACGLVKRVYSTPVER